MKIESRQNANFKSQFRAHLPYFKIERRLKIYLNISGLNLYARYKNLKNSALGLSEDCLRLPISCWSGELVFC